MIKTKLYRTLSVLKTTELNRLQKYLKRRYSSAGLKALTLHLIDCLKQGTAPEKQAVWEALEPTRPYDDKQFRKACTDALRDIEVFLGIEAFQADQMLASTMQLQALSRRELKSLYKTQLARVRKLAERHPIRSADFFYYLYRIEQSDYQMNQSSLRRFNVANLDEIMKNLDTFYVIEKLRYQCEVLSRSSFVEHEYSRVLIDEILQLVDAGEFSDNPVVGIYHKIILSHLEPEDESHYFDLKQALRDHARILEPLRMKEVYDSALNYCNRKINQGKDHFLQESFYLYRRVLDEELILVDGYITHWTFKNVVVLALRLHEYDWAEAFIHDFGQRIEPVFRENAITYNRAQLLFYRSNFAEALRLLQKVEYQDVTYNLGAKTMLLATYYELGEWDALDAMGQSFKAYINRKKHTIQEGRRRSYLNLISFTTRLAAISDRDRVAMERLFDRFDNTKQIASAHWIREKMNAKRRRSSPNPVS